LAHPDQRSPELLFFFFPEFLLYPCSCTSKNIIYFTWLVIFCSHGWLAQVMAGFFNWIIQAYNKKLWAWIGNKQKADIV
jgi:hypothetical protein